MSQVNNVINFFIKKNITSLEIFNSTNNNSKSFDGFNSDTIYVENYSNNIIFEKNIKDIFNDADIKRYHIHHYKKEEDAVSSNIIIDFKTESEDIHLFFFFDFYDQKDNFGIFDVYLLKDNDFLNLDDSSVESKLDKEKFTIIDNIIKTVFEKFKEFYVISELYLVNN